MSRIYIAKTVPILSRWCRKVRAISEDERGIGLAESLVAVAILGTAVVALTVALSTGSLAVNTSGQEVRVQSLAQSQLAYTKSYPYQPSAVYPTVDMYSATYNPNPIILPDGYSISVTASPTADTDPDIQKITATISRDGENMLTIEDFKVNR